MNNLLALAIGAIPSLKFAEKVTLFKQITTVEEFCSIRPIDLVQVLRRMPKNTVWDPASLLQSAELVHKELTKKSISLLNPTEAAYPPQLSEIYDPPFLLFYRGSLPQWTETFLAVVGTRQPTSLGRRASYQLGREAAELGMVVVSGLAKGIDGEAHRGSLDGKGRTIAVLGHGPDTVYPLVNRKLGERILTDGGMLVSEYPPGTPPLPYHFPARNRIISGLCRGVIVVEAPEGSGALITAEYALEQGRDLLIHRVCMESSRGAGSRKLGEDGATIVENCKDLLQYWGLKHDTEGPRNPVGKNSESISPLFPGEWLAHQLEEELKQKR